MPVNKEATIQYYEKYTPCNCGDCKYFIEHIEKKQPDICEYLKKLGIDPLKPYELMSIHTEKEKRIEYIDCAYLIIGNIDKEVEQEINGMKVAFRLKDGYPTENISDDYYFISFGPISMSYTYDCNRKYTYEEKVNRIKKAIDEMDPMLLLAMQCPKDEYMQEAELLAKEIERKSIVKAELVQKIFSNQFGEILSLKICNKIAKRIRFYLDIQDYFKDLEENESLKGRVSIEDFEITLKVHDKFIVTSVGQMIYINDKFYYDIEEQDLLDSLCAFMEDKDTIYVQYKHKHFEFHFFRGFRFFKKIKRSKFLYRKLKHKKDIELIFDNKGVIYSQTSNECSIENITKMTMNESLKEKYEKMFYSPERRKRLIIKKNNVGSYSYYIEKLTILDIDETVMNGHHAFWEPEYGTNASFYESIDALIRDIKVEIDGWIEYE